MAEAVTEVHVPGGAGFGYWGKINRDEALRRARRDASKAVEAHLLLIEAIDAGTEQVVWRRGSTPLPEPTGPSLADRESDGPQILVEWGFGSPNRPEDFTVCESHEEAQTRRDRQAELGHTDLRVGAKTSLGWRFFE